MYVFDDNLVFSCIFYEKVIHISEIEDFNINFLHGKIKLKDKVIVVPPVKGGDLRKVEELLQK